MENKKIRGATSKEYNGIKFRSTMEVSCYKKLEQSGLEFYYERDKFTLVDGFNLDKVKLLAPNHLGRGKYAKELSEQTTKIRSITYTPDFLVIKDDYRIYFDVKGFANDTYPLKKKSFIKYLEDLSNDKYSYIFIEPHSVKQMIQAIDYINKL